MIPPYFLAQVYGTTYSNSNYLLGHVLYAFYILLLIVDKWYLYQPHRNSPLDTKRIR